MVICLDCGKDVKDAKFCSNCGALLSKVEEQIAEEVVEEVVPQEVVDEIAPEEDIEESSSEEIVDESAFEEETEDSEEIPEETISDENAETKKTRFCTNCGAEIATDVAFCPQCGFKFKQDEPQTKFCQTCGKKININAEICPYCGVRVAGVAPTEEKNVFFSCDIKLLIPGVRSFIQWFDQKRNQFYNCIYCFRYSCIPLNWCNFNYYSLDLGFN